jgi:hypothetical protein
MGSEFKMSTSQDEHFLPPLNRWINREGELGHPTIP